MGQNTLGLPQIINYTKNDFHGGSQTWCISQDKRGLMYFANNEGLITFDGNYWKVYPLPNKTIMRSLAISNDDKIYVGGQGEIGYFSPDVNGILKYTSLTNLIPKLQNTFADIWKIEIFNESIFFHASDRIFELKNNSIKIHLPKVEWQYLTKTGNRLFAQDKNNGLFEYKQNAWYPIGNQKLTRESVLSGIIKMGADSFLLTSKKNGFLLLDKGSLTTPQNSVTSTFFNHIYTAVQVNQTEFVAGTTSQGCFILDFKGNIIQKISTNEGLQNNNVLCVFLDRNNNLWAGLNNGISFIAYNSAIKYIKTNKENELAGYSTVIFNKHLYIGTSDGAYVAPLTDSNKDFSFSKGVFTPIKNTAGEVWRIEEVNQQLLIGHHDGIFFIKDFESYPISKETGCWLFVPLSTVLPAKNILVGTYTGLQRIEFHQNHFSNEGNIEGLRESFRFIAVDNNDEIWASHPYRGIFRIRISKDNKNYSAQLFTEKNGLPSTLENYVFKIKNKVVFATSKGIYEFDDAAGKFIPSTFLSPVFHSMEVRYLREDNDGNIWFCSGKKIGVAIYNQNNKAKPYSITYFPELTGQILSGFENIYPYNDENIFIASEKGVIHLNYVRYAANKLQIKVLLGEVKAFGKTDSVIFGGYFHLNKDSIYTQSESETLHLPNSYNSFHFEYSSPNYGLQKNIEYSYQLKGYDARWSEWSPKNEKDYTNLPAGKYVFNIKAHDNLGHESAIVSYSFVVDPAWYNTVWANLFYLLLIMLLLYLLYKWQERKLYLQQIKFEQEQKRLKDLHQLAVEKNEKEIIKLQNEKLANEVKFKNKELAGATLHLVERTDALSKVKEELQTLYKKTGNNHDVKKTLQLLNDIEKNNSNWEQFASHFDEVNNDFLKKIKSLYPILSKTDLKLCAYLQLNLSTKEIAQLMNISVRGVEIGRYRLRKKLGLSTEQSLNDFLNNIS
ncbi:MAG: triple tyrosine motif-containing protein [Ginsengibacter sp.]